MKKVLILCLVVVFAVVLTACGSDKAAEEGTTDTVKIEKNIDAVAEALNLSGKSETYYEMIGADDGAEFNDGTIEIYQYDPESEAYKNIEAGKGDIEAEACNSGFILVVPDGTEPDQDIIDAFNKLVF